MKNSVTNLLSVKLAIAGIILAGLFLFAPSQANAQTTSDLFSAPNITYVSNQTAISKVEEKIIALKYQYTVLTHGTQAYTDNETKYAFYALILDNLNAGKSTKESLEAGLKYFGTDAASTMSKTNMMAARQEAINLLKQ